MTMATFTALVLALLRGVLPVFAGYALTRWCGLASDALRTLLRYVLLPAVLFSALLGPVQQRTFMILCGTGVVIALAAYFLARLLAQKLAAQLSLTAATPALAAFSLPFLALAFGGRGAAAFTVALLFVVVSLALAFAELGEQGFGALIREPWLYAVVAVLVLRMTGVPLQGVVRLIDPLVDAGFVLLLIYFGTRLHPFSGFAVGAAWLGAALRLGVAAGVAVAAIVIFDLSAGVQQGVIVAALAPSAAGSLALSRGGKERDDGRTTLVVSTTLALIVLALWRAFGRA